MTTDLRDQLRSYGEHWGETLELWRIDEIIARETPLRAPVGYRRFRPVAVVALSAMAVLALIGGVLLLLRPSMEQDPVAPLPPTAPVSQPPANPPVTQLPITQPPVTPAPVTQPPATPPPASQPPVSLPPPEGFEWDLIELDPALFSLGASIRDVTHTGSIYIAVGYDSDDCGRIWLSDDGSGWELAPLQPSESGPCVPLFSKVAAAGDRAMALANNVDGPSVWMSDNGGHDWYELPRSGTPLRDARGVVSLAAIRDAFVVVVRGEECSGPECTDVSGLWSTQDGEVWTLGDSEATALVVDLASGPAGLVAIARGPGSVQFPDGDFDAPGVLHSPDGLTWSVAAVLEGIAVDGENCLVQTHAVAAALAGYVTAGTCAPSDAEYTYSSVWHSPDAGVWTQAPFDAPAFDTPAYVIDLAASGSGFLAAGYTMVPGEDHAALWFSADGSDWLRTDLLQDVSSHANAVAMLEDSAIAVGSRDGIPVVWIGSRP